MIEPRQDDAPIYCPRCGSLCDMEIGEIVAKLATYVEPFIWCTACPFVTEVADGGDLVEGSPLRFDMLTHPPAALENPDDFTFRRPVPLRVDS